MIARSVCPFCALYIVLIFVLTPVRFYFLVWFSFFSFLHTTCTFFLNYPLPVKLTNFESVQCPNNHAWGKYNRKQTITHIITNIHHLFFFVFSFILSFNLIFDFYLFIVAARCSETLLLVSTPSARTCTGCKRKVLPVTARAKDLHKSQWLDKCLSSVGACPACDQRLEQFFS